MKNFALASLVFLIWAFFGAWMHAYTHPKKEFKKIVPVKTKPKSVFNKIKKDTVLITPIKKDTVLIKKTTINPFPKNIVFLEFGQSSFKKTAKVNQYIKSLKSYLRKNKNTTVYIVGHTDVIGAKKDNYNVGLERANNYKQFLISQGINRHKIQTASKGEEEPLDPKLKKGWKSDNRIEITVKQNSHE